jgi:hypothetical protein
MAASIKKPIIDSLADIALLSESEEAENTVLESLQRGSGDGIRGTAQQQQGAGGGTDEAARKGSNEVTNHATR